MWICILALLAFVSSYAQSSGVELSSSSIFEGAIHPDYLEPSPGCFQFKIEFTSSSIDENCQFTNQAYVDAVWGSPETRATCKAQIGTLIPGMYRTNSLTCPDDGYLYTACCTADNCDEKVAVWQAYCESQGFSYWGSCDENGNLKDNIGCSWLPNSSTNNGDNSNASIELDALNQANDNLKILINDNNTRLNILYSELYNTRMQIQKGTEDIAWGVSSLNDLGAMQLHELQDIRNQTIKARFEQSGLLANIELIEEENQITSIHMDSLLQEIRNAMNDSVYVDNSGLSSQLAGFQSAILHADTNYGSDTSYGEYDDSTIGTYMVDTVKDFTGAYEQAIQNAVDSIATPNYDSLAQMLLEPYSAITDDNSCPDFAFEADLPSIMGGNRIIDLKFCQLNVFGSNLWTIIRLILTIFVNSWCALVLYRASLAVFSGTHKGTNWMNFS